MYKVRFNTENFQSKSNRREWENQLKNDFAVAINGKEFECETQDDLINRLDFIAGHGSTLNYNENSITLESEVYNKQICKLAMYGIPQGYINSNIIADEVNKKGKTTIPFNHYYDLRQGKFFNGCYVEVEKL